MDTRKVKHSKPKPSAAPQRTPDPTVDPSASGINPHARQNRAISNVPSASRKPRKPLRTTPQQLITPVRREETVSDRPSASYTAPPTSVTPRNRGSNNTAAPVSHLATSPVRKLAASSSSSPSTSAGQGGIASNPSPDVADIDARPPTSWSPLGQAGVTAWENIASRDTAGPRGSPSSDTSTVPDESCDDAIHPAYSSSYPFSLCPSCRLDACVRAVRTTNSALMAHGGSQQWMAYIHRELGGEQGKSELYESQFWRGKREPRTKGRRNDGSVSYPTSRASLKNLVSELEERRGQEQAWETWNPVQILDCAVLRQLEDCRATSATNTLERYKSIDKDRKLHEVEQASSAFSRKRGREWQIASEDDFPGPHDLFAPDTTLTDKQEMFMDAALMLDHGLHEYESDSVSPKRKRRRLDTNVHFHPLVYVRTEADIDAICGPTAPWRDIARQPIPARASRGILLTAPGHIDPTPRRPHIVRALQWEDRNSTSCGITKGARRWKPTPGSERVDTSGCKYGKNDISWMLYIDSFDENPVTLDSTAAHLQRSQDDAVHEVVLQSPAQPPQQTPQADGLDEDEVPTEQELAQAERQIQQRLILEQAERVIARSRLSQSADYARLRRRRTPGQQIRDEMEDQRRRGAEVVVARDGFRPHGGVASAFTFGGFVRAAAMGILRRYDVL